MAHLKRWFSQLETSIPKGFSMAMLNHQMVTKLRTYQEIWRHGTLESQEIWASIPGLWKMIFVGYTAILWRLQCWTLGILGGMDNEHNNILYNKYVCNDICGFSWPNLISQPPRIWDLWHPIHLNQHATIVEVRHESCESKVASEHVCIPMPPIAFLYGNHYPTDGCLQSDQVWWSIFAPFILGLEPFGVT